jgi:hypothetical protein
LRPTWEVLDELFHESLRVADTARPLNYGAFDNLTAFAHAAIQCAPEFLEQKGFPDKYEAEIAAILLNTESEAEDDPDTTDPEELRNIAGRVDSIASSVERLGALSLSHGSTAQKLAQRLRRHSSILEEWAAENDPPEPDSNEGYISSEESVAAFDISMLFSEL